MFEHKNAKVIIQNAPRYSKIIEPFGDGGSLAFVSAKKKPKEHILNVLDEVKFTLFSFLQNLSSADKAALKAKDWVASPETFDNVMKINATEGADYFYKWLYLKHFGVFDMKDMMKPPVFDWVVTGKNIKNKTFDLPVLKIALKGVTITNEDPISVIGKASGADSYLILTPKTPEDVAAIEAKMNSISTPFIFIKKSKANDDLISTFESTQNKVSVIFPGSVMPGRAAVVTNFENKLIQLDPEQMEKSA